MTWFQFTKHYIESEDLTSLLNILQYFQCGIHANHFEDQRATYCGHEWGPKKRAHIFIPKGFRRGMGGGSLHDPIFISSIMMCWFVLWDLYIQLSLCLCDMNGYSQKKHWLSTCNLSKLEIKLFQDTQIRTLAGNEKYHDQMLII